MTHLCLGDKIKSNGKFSPIAYGEIVGVQIGYMYYLSTGGNPEIFEHWTEANPNWLHEPVYVVKKYLPDFHVYVDDPEIPWECKEKIKEESKANRIRRRFIAYISAEVDNLPDDYDFVTEVEKEINKND